MAWSRLHALHLRRVRKCQAWTSAWTRIERARTVKTRTTGASNGVVGGGRAVIVRSKGTCVARPSRAKGHAAMRVRGACDVRAPAVHLRAPEGVHGPRRVSDANGLRRSRRGLCRVFICIVRTDCPVRQCWWFVRSSRWGVLIVFGRCHSSGFPSECR